MDLPWSSRGMRVERRRSRRRKELKCGVFGRAYCHFAVARLLQFQIDIDVPLSSVVRFGFGSGIWFQDLVTLTVSLSTHGNC